MNTDGSGLARLTAYANGHSAFYPDFSADGRTLSIGTPYETPGSHLPRATLYTLDAASGRFRKALEVLHAVRDVRVHYRRDLSSGRERLVERNVIPLAWRPDGRILFLRGRVVSGEGVFAVVVARADGTRERLVAVTDEEDVNIGSLPAWQPVRAPLAAAAAPFAPRADGGRCIRLLIGLRSRLGG